MKKILYISFLEVSDNQPQGVSKKIQAQINSLKSLDTYVIYTGVLKKDMYLFLGDGTKKRLFSLKKSPYVNRTQLYKVLLTKKIQEHIKDVQYLYIRHEGSVITQIPFFKQAKKNHSKILLEVPTYPYDQEWGDSLVAKIYFWQEMKLSKLLGRKIDFISTFSKDKKIFGVECINISNGINLEENSLIKKQRNLDIIVFSSVSICSKWHGVDRFLNSLGEYLEQNPTKKIKFNIVGEGAETINLKKIVTDSKHLANVVVFHGFKSGEELDAIYNETDIAVGSLGIHRIGLKEVQPLKNREYAAKGIPFIISFKDPDFEKQPFVFKTTNDEDLIDIEALIEWYQKNDFCPREIREYAKQFSWDTQMKKVIDAIEKKEN